MADFGRLLFEKRAKVLVLFAEMKNVTAKKRRFRTIFRTRCTRARNITLRLFKTYEEKGCVKDEKLPRTPNVRSPAAVEGTSCGEPAQP